MLKKLFPLLIVLVLFSSSCAAAPTSDTFAFQVKVLDMNEQPVQGEVIIIMVNADPPLSKPTNQDGIARFELPITYNGETGELSIKNTQIRKDVLITENQTIIEKLSKIPTTFPPTWTPTLFVTPTEDRIFPSPTPTYAVLTPTPTKIPTLSPSATATATPKPSPTETNIPITPTTPPPVSPATSVIPQLSAPSNGRTFKNPISFQWSGTLGHGQVYRVMAHHPGTGELVVSPSLTEKIWVVDLPVQIGEWRWHVTVIQNGKELKTSEEWMFWYNPDFGSDSGSSTTDDSPSPTFTPPL